MSLFSHAPDGLVLALVLVSVPPLTVWSAYLLSLCLLGWVKQGAEEEAARVAALSSAGESVEAEPEGIREGAEASSSDSATGAPEKGL